MTHIRHGHRRPALELTRSRKHFIYAILITTWLSGAVWLVLHYFFARRGEFGAEPNPFEFWILALHGACAFATLWLAGWIWTTHIEPWWRGGRRRRNSGVVLISVALILIVSGYLLYYASGDALREWTALVHWIVGLIAAIPMIVHALRSALYRRPS
ncbi:MAG: hypothetical protein ABJB01_07945 [Rudaea sp.]